MLLFEKTSLAEEIEELIGKYGNSRSALLPILQKIQSKYRYISAYAQQEIASHLKIQPVEVYSVISFYAYLNSEPKGRNIVRVCKTISCDMKNRISIVKAIERELGIEMGETTRDNKFTIEYTNCIGFCDEGPAMEINGQVFSKLTPERAVEHLHEVVGLQWKK